MSKVCFQKIINVNLFFNSLTSIIAEFPTSKLIFVISYLRKKRLNHMSLFFLFSRFFGKIYQLHAKVLIGEKSTKKCKQPLKVFCKNGYSSKWLFYRVSSWLHDQNRWKIPVKKFNFNRNWTPLQTYFNWFSNDWEQLFCRRSPSSCF